MIELSFSFVLSSLSGSAISRFLLMSSDRAHVSQSSKTVGSKKFSLRSETKSMSVEGASRVRSAGSCGPSSQSKSWTIPCAAQDVPESLEREPCAQGETCSVWLLGSTSGPCWRVVSLVDARRIFTRRCETRSELGNAVGPCVSSSYMLLYSKWRLDGLHQYG